MKYIHQVFLPATLEDAKNVSLSNDPTDPYKFREETEFLMDIIREQSLITEETRVLDFGCGMGRVSKMLIDTFHCRADGVDTSPSMRYFAHQYVAHKDFSVRPKITGTYDVALAAFVFQHVERPDIEISTLREHLHAGGKLLVVNEHKRLVPTGVNEEGFVVWSDDGIDIDALLSQSFSLLHSFPYYKHRDISCTLWQK